MVAISVSSLQLSETHLGQQGTSGRLVPKMLLFIVIPLLILGCTDSKQSLRKKREVDPETFMNISEVIQYQGYPNEEYEILTDDGYYLPINRIPYGNTNSGNSASKPVVLVMPGVLTNGGSWVASMPNNSLGFILADAGFDVWLANNRGCRWCRRHQNFSIDEEKFWDFSFHEMGMNDLPAIINFVLAKTGQEKIFYIGHSQGSTIAFIAFSAIPQLAQKIKVFFAFGPVAFLNHSKSPYPRLAFLADKVGKLKLNPRWRRIAEPLLQLLDVPPLHCMGDAFLGKKEFCVLHNNTRQFIAKTCDKDLWENICVKLLFSAGGISKNNLDMSRLGVIASHLPGCTSVKNLLHWAQGTPPAYNIQRMDVPTAVWSGRSDIMATPKDTKKLLPLLKNLIYYKEIPHWMHYDFIFGLDARQEVYDELIEIIQNFP